MTRPIMMSEVREMRRRIEAGEGPTAIGRDLGRDWSTVRRHGDVNHVAGRKKALRLEKLFTACNRALEARP